jgi:hypothetical protein
MRAVRQHRSYSVMVSTQDSDSCIPSSNLGRTFLPTDWCLPSPFNQSIMEITRLIHIVPLSTIRAAYIYDVSVKYQINLKYEPGLSRFLPVLQWVNGSLYIWCLSEVPNKYKISVCPPSLPREDQRKAYLPRGLNPRPEVPNESKLYEPGVWAPVCPYFNGSTVLCIYDVSVKYQININTSLPPLLPRENQRKAYPPRGLNPRPEVPNTYQLYEPGLWVPVCPYFNGSTVLSIYMTSQWSAK